MEEHPIPPMTHDLSRYWDQPDRFRILIDDTHTLMTRTDFVQLKNYETSTPSGTYEGKMWRAGTHLRWYGPNENPDLLTIHQRDILLID